MATGGPNNVTDELSAALSALLAEFLEAAVHSVLYAKSVYPREAFESTRIWDTGSFKHCLHPGVKAYIGNAIAHLQASEHCYLLSELVTPWHTDRFCGTNLMVGLLVYVCSHFCSMAVSVR
jgi:hypothetical protein